MLLLHTGLLHSCYISLIHGLIEVIVNLFALLIDHGPPLVDDLDLLTLVSLDGDLKTLLVLSDVVYLFLKVNYQALDSVDQMILSLEFQS